MLLQSPLRNGDHPEEKIMDPVMMTVMHDGDTFFYYDSYLIMMSMMIIDDVMIYSQMMSGLFLSLVSVGSSCA